VKQLISIPFAVIVGLFNWVGSQTFQGGEKVWATFLLGYCIVLFCVAIANLFTPRLSRLHTWLIFGAAVGVALTILYLNM
jgi:hypothetical protein